LNVLSVGIYQTPENGVMGYSIFWPLRDMACSDVRTNFELTD
jgi:hypothetical protein